MNELNLYFVGLVLLLLCGWYSRYIMQGAMSILNDEQKVNLIQLFQKNNKFGGLFAVGALVVFFILLQTTQVPMLYLVFGIFILMIIKIIISYIAKLGKLKSHDYPTGYIQKYNLAAFIQIGGFVLFSVLSIIMLL